MARTPKRQTSRDAARADGKRLVPPPDGATVRMYRIGHGDCFLLAFAGATPGRPAYVLIDCGYKPGSSKYITNPEETVPRIGEIARSIREATGGHVDIAVITHEHQDHVNGITAANFAGVTVGQTWLAWTEDPGDAVANKLRKAFKDKLLGLFEARNRLAADGDAARALRIDELLAFELGGEDEAFDAPAAARMLQAADEAAQSRNKQSMKVLKDLAKDGVKYLRPHEEILAVPGAKGVRVFALGPPRDQEQIEDLDPQHDERFHRSLATASPGNYFAAAVRSAGGHGQSPFAGRYAVPQARALGDSEFGAFFSGHYGAGGTAAAFAPGAGRRSADGEVPDNPDWRRIDREWLYSTEQLALDMNDYTNNSSLVLAFELGKGGKVLLFVADAQRGNWASWGKKDWADGDRKVTARDLLARTVLYKVGHHGSHNATLNGLAGGEVANLGWMAQGEYAREFTAMITAVRTWAETQKGWDHPLKAIKDALLTKASGRVFQTDTELAAMTAPVGAAPADWGRFLSRVREDRLYFDYEVTAE